MNIEEVTEETITITFTKEEFESVDSDVMSARSEGFTDSYWMMRQINAVAKLFTDKYNPNVDNDDD